MLSSRTVVSQELHDAFNKLVSARGDDQRGLLAGIRNEQLVPLESIPSRSTDFFSDLAPLQDLLKDDEAAYVILRRYADATAANAADADDDDDDGQGHGHRDAPDGFVAVTYVPDTANVRQKMLFASSRLTLVRELGSERFRETVFATRKDELSADGFRRQEKHDRQYVCPSLTVSLRGSCVFVRGMIRLARFKKKLSNLCARPSERHL